MKTIVPIVVKNLPVFYSHSKARDSNKWVAGLDPLDPNAKFQATLRMKRVVGRGRSRNRLSRMTGV